MVDIIRRAYRTQMEFAGVGKVWVRWYFVPAFHEPLPFPTPYNSRNWRIRQGWNAGIVGEVRGAPRPWSNGRGDNDCDGMKGDASAWAGNVAPLIQCEELEFWDGGVEIGGEWLVTYTEPFHGEGGGEGNGEGGWLYGFTASGGGEGNGAGSFRSPWVASGGGEGNGAGSFRSPWTGAGGGEGNGSGLWGSGWVSTGGGEGDGVGTFGTAGMVATGGGEGNGAGEWSALPPGSSCPTARLITLPYTGTFTVGTAAQHWWKFAATNGVQYHVRYSAVSGGSAPTSAVTHGTCGAPSAVMSVLVPGCNAATAGTSDDWMIVLNGSVMAPVTYTIEVATGPC